MRLFGISMFCVLAAEDDYIRALVAWADACQDGIPDREDMQEVRWACRSDTLIDDALTIGEYAFDAGWVSSDKISIEHNATRIALGWDDEKIACATNELLQTCADMLDANEVTDVFQLHR